MRSSLRTLFFLTLVFLMAIGFSVSAEASPSQQTPEPVQITGVVTVNDDLAPSGTSLAASLEDGTVCGITSTTDNGQYELTLSSVCMTSPILKASLEAVGASTEVEVTGLAEPQTVNISFGGLSQADLITLGIVLAAAEPKDEALLTDDNLRLVLMTVIIGELILLGLMVFSPAGDQSYKRQVEAMVLLGVVVAIIILGVTGKIGDEGLVSVLAAIVGYTIGKMAGGGGQSASGGGAGTP